MHTADKLSRLDCVVRNVSGYIFISFRASTSLGARQKQPGGSSKTLANNSSTFRPRSHSPSVARQSPSVQYTRERSGKVQQSRSLDERRSRISRKRNSSFSTLTTEESSSVYTAPPPPTITLRRPSLTCPQPGVALNV